MSDDEESLGLLSIILGAVGLFKYKITWFISLVGVLFFAAHHAYKYYVIKPSDNETVLEEVEEVVVWEETIPLDTISVVSMDESPIEDTNVEGIVPIQNNKVDDNNKNKTNSNDKTKIIEPPKKKYPEFLVKQYPSGEKYEGYVNNKGQKHGKGTYTWLNGDKYVGDWVNDKAKGQGIYYSREGWRYEGQFSNSVFHGLGTYYFENGKSKKGTWKNGEYQK